MQKLGLKWTVRRQITAGLVVLTCIVAALVVAANLMLRTVQSDVNTLAENLSPAALKLLNIDRDGYQAQLALERIVAQPAGIDVTTERADWDENSSQTLSRFDEFSELSVDLDGEAEVTALLVDLRGEWLAAAAATLAAAPADQPALLAQARDAFLTYRDQVDVLEEQLYEAEEAALADRVRARQQQLVVTNWLALVLALVAGGVIIRLVSSRIGESITSRSASVQRASLTLGNLASGITDRAMTTAEQADSARNSADHVASSVSGVNVAVEELSTCISEIARNASVATTVAGDAVSMADAANQIIEQLGESSERIGEVVKVINAIAEQTNLLALNATIEAARAGESGRGFAVVAGEVKELAGETARATGEIAARVSAIQQDTNAAISANRSINEIIGRISELQHSIAAAMEEQSITTAQIANGASDAAHSSMEISAAVATVASQAAATVAAGEEAGASAVALTQLAEELDGLVKA